MRKLYLTIFFLLYSCVTSSAHDYWIIPDTFNPSESTIVESSFSCGHKYFMDGEVPDITKFKPNLLTPQGISIPLAYSRVGSKVAKIMVPVLGRGTYVMSVSNTMPSYWTVSKNGWVPKPKSMVKNAIKGGKYFKSLKTFLTVGSGSDSYDKIMGYKIEIVPQKNPTTLRPGQALPILVLYDGKPLEGANIFGIFEGYSSTEKDSFPIETKTDKNGLASISMNRPGHWLIGAKYQFNTNKDNDADYENYRAYIMFNE